MLASMLSYMVDRDERNTKAKEEGKEADRHTTEEKEEREKKVRE